MKPSQNAKSKGVFGTTDNLLHYFKYIQHSKYDCFVKYRVGFLWERFFLHVYMKHNFKTSCSTTCRQGKLLIPKKLFDLFLWQLCTKPMPVYTLMTIKTGLCIRTKQLTIFCCNWRWFFFLLLSYGVPISANIYLYPKIQTFLTMYVLRTYSYFSI